MGSNIPNNVKQQVPGNVEPQDKKSQTYSEWVKDAYNDKYEQWMPWIEDQYLRWFGKGDNKASYTTKDSLSKTKVTGVNQLDQVQDDVHNLVGNQLGDKGLLAPVGQAASKEGINRAERNGKEEDGSYGGPAASVVDAGKNGVNAVGSGLSSGGESVKNAASGGVSSVTGILGGK